MSTVNEQYRCKWARDNPLLLKYHDEEWAVPVYDDRILFEFIILEGAQAGLNWQTILNKRQTYRKAFHNFNVHKIAGYKAKDIKRLLSDPGIIRNRLKIIAAIQNAKAVLATQKEFDSFNEYIWQFVGNKPIKHRIKTMKAVPVYIKEAEVMSKNLRTRGFKFVGPTICYAFMQAVGMVNDHEVKCFRYKEV